MIQKSNIQKVFSMFCTFPTTKLYLKQITKCTRLSHTSITPILKKLEKQKLIIKTIEQRGKRKFPYYHANRENKEFIQEKRLLNFYQIHDSGIIKFLETQTSPDCIILFGSYEKGEDDETSDIDIYIQAKKTKVNIGKYEKLFNKKIELHFRSKFSMYAKELQSNIINGIVLQGYLNTKDETQSSSRLSKSKGSS